MDMMNSHNPSPIFQLPGIPGVKSQYGQFSSLNVCREFVVTSRDPHILVGARDVGPLINGMMGRLFLWDGGTATALYDRWPKCHCTILLFRPIGCVISRASDALARGVSCTPTE